MSNKNYESHRKAIVSKGIPEKASIRRLILLASAVCCKRMRTPGSTSCIAMVG